MEPKRVTIIVLKEWSNIEMVRAISGEMPKEVRTKTKLASYIPKLLGVKGKTRIRLTMLIHKKMIIIEGVIPKERNIK